VKSLQRKRSLTAVVSFSCDLETLNKLAAWSILKDMSRSRAISYLLRMGFIYTNMLEEQKGAAGVNDGEEKPKSA